jgi:hypothetical protein
MTAKQNLVTDTGTIYDEEVKSLYLTKMWFSMYENL